MRIVNSQEVKFNEIKSIMDESNPSQQNGSIGNLPSQGNSSNMNSKGISDENNVASSNTAQYTIPGVLHFIQHEWARFELERSQWDVDRAELQVSSIDRYYSLSCIRVCVCVWAQNHFEVFVRFCTFF